MRPGEKWAFKALDANTKESAQSTVTVSDPPEILRIGQINAKYVIGDADGQIAIVYLYPDPALVSVLVVLEGQFGTKSARVAQCFFLGAGVQSSYSGFALFGTQSEILNQISSGTIPQTNPCSFSRQGIDAAARTPAQISGALQKRLLEIIPAELKTLQRQ